MKDYEKSRGTYPLTCGDDEPEDGACCSTGGDAPAAALERSLSCLSFLQSVQIENFQAFRVSQKIIHCQVTPSSLLQLEFSARTYLERFDREFSSWLRHCPAYLFSVPRALLSSPAPAYSTWLCAFPVLFSAFRAQSIFPSEIRVQK